MEDIKLQLKKMDVEYKSLSEIRSKDGIGVYRVLCEETSYIIKYFENQIYRREIEYYKLLQSLEFQTIKVIGKTDCALLMEDIEQSEVYRLGKESDLSDPALARVIAKWYKELHTKGKEYILKHGDNIYSENNCITFDNLRNISIWTNTEDHPVWNYIETHLEEIKHLIDKVAKTITYNDFYYTNLIVKKDMSFAFMYDYNLLGKGYAYADIRNVTYSLDGAAKESFLEEYGEFNDEEASIDEVVSVLTSLHSACKYKGIPKWAIKYTEQIEQGIFLNKVESLINQ